MKLFKFIFFCFFLLTAILTKAQQNLIAIDSLQKEENKITGNVEVNYKRRYLWRALEFGNDYVSQPEINLSYKNFRLYTSSYFNLKPSILPTSIYTKKTIFDEQDIEVGYAKTFKKLEIEVVLQNYFYFYQANQPNVSELTANFNYELTSHWNLFTSTSFGLRGYKNSLYNFNGITYNKLIKNNNELTYKAYFSISNNIYTDNYFQGEAAGLTFIGNRLSFNHNFKNFYLKTEAEWNYYANKKIRQNTLLTNTYNYIIGVGYNF